MVGTDKIYIINGDINLEAEVLESKINNKSTIIVCHPHPQIN